MPDADGAADGREFGERGGELGRRVTAVAAVVERLEIQRLPGQDVAVRGNKFHFTSCGHGPPRVVPSGHAARHLKVPVPIDDLRLDPATVHLVGLQPVDALSDQIGRGRSGDCATGEEGAKQKGNRGEVHRRRLSQAGSEDQIKKPNRCRHPDGCARKERKRPISEKGP